jgi:hypothetical protein
MSGLIALIELIAIKAYRGVFMNRPFHTLLSAVLVFCLSFAGLGTGQSFRFSIDYAFNSE